MVRSLQLLCLGLAFLLLDGLYAQAQQAPTATQPPAAQPEPAQADTTKAPKSPEEKAQFYGLPGEDPPQPFVPLTPISDSDRKRIEAITDFSVARALEDRRSWSDAIGLLEEALKLEPESVTILRRISRLCFILSRTDAGIKYCKLTLKLEPGDTDTIARLVAYYRQKNEPEGAESVLKDVLSNDKLDAKSPGRLLAEFEIGKLYSGPLKQIDKAAEAYAKVLERLDNKEVNQLSAVDLRRIFGGDEGAAYEEFGLVFLQAKRNDLAIKAFERGLDYDPEDPELPLLLIQTLLKENQTERALSLVDQFLKRQPQGVEGYELLTTILKSLKREKELTSRLEEAAKSDSKNVSLQYFLADHYRETGAVEKADELEKALLAAAPSSQAFSARALSLLKRKKAPEFLRVITDAISRRGGFEAIRESLQAAALDPDFSLEVMKAGQQLLEADPVMLSPDGVSIVAILASRSGHLAEFLPIQKLALAKRPSPQAYEELTKVFVDLKRYKEAVATYEEMLTKYPEERTVRHLADLVKIYSSDQNLKDSERVVREALKIDPNDLECQVQLAVVLSQTDRANESITLLRETAAKNPTNPGILSILGSILMQAGLNDEALKLYKEIIDRYPNNDDLVRVCRSTMSVIYVNMGDYPKGEAELEILFEHDPEEIGVNNDLGYLYAEQGKNLDKAEMMIRKAVQGDPENFAYLDSLGWVLFKRGKLKEAIDPLTKAVKFLTAEGKPDATVHEHLGDVYFQLKDFEKSREAWKAAEVLANQATPPDKRLPEIKKKLESLEKLSKLPQAGAGNTP